MSFSHAWTDTARDLADDLVAAGLSVRFDAWDGGGGVPAVQRVPVRWEGVMALLPVLTPSDSAPTWISGRWQREVYGPALARGLPLLPVLAPDAAQDMAAIPEFLRERSVADLRGVDRQAEFQRLVRTLRRHRGEPDIDLAAVNPLANRAPADPPAVLAIGPALAKRRLDGPTLADRVRSMLPLMSDGLSYELGHRPPDVQVVEDASLAADEAQVRLYGVPEDALRLPPHAALVDEHPDHLGARSLGLPVHRNPASGHPMAWVAEDQCDALEREGYTTWAADGALILMVSATLRRRAVAFMTVHQAQARLDAAAALLPQLVASVVPQPVPLVVFTDVLRRLLGELVSIRNLRRILMVLAHWGRFERDPAMLTEYVRAGLNRQLSHQLGHGQGELTVFLLDPALEAQVEGALRHTALGSYLDLPADTLKRLALSLRSAMAALPPGTRPPQILTRVEIRAAIRRLVAPSLPMLHVISYEEVDPAMRIQPLGRISLDGLQRRAGVSAFGLPVWG